MPTTDDGPAGFCRSLAWTVPIDWFGTTGYTPLDSARRARIELTIHDGRRTAVSTSYCAFNLTILDIHDGVIDRATFVFDDYLSSAADYPLPPNTRRFAVASHLGWRWHGAPPAATRPLTTAVEHYLDVFRTRR